MKQSRKHFGRKRKATVPGYQLCETKGHLNLKSCLHYDIIHSSPIIGKYVNKYKLYRQCPPLIVKYTNTNEINNASCVKNVLTVKPVLKTEIKKWGANSILRNVDDGVYICRYSVQSIDYQYNKIYAFFYYSNFKPLHQPKFYGDLIYNRATAPIVSG